MSKLTTEERIVRLETCFLTFASVITGEMQSVAKNQEEYNTQLMNMAKMMKEMSEDIR